MRPHLFLVAALAVTASSAPGVLEAATRHAAAAPLGRSTAPSEAALQVRAVVDRYCVTCHNERLKTAGLLLDHANPANVGAER